MTRLLVVLAALLALAVVAHAQDAPARPPNVVLVLADDLGWGDLGSYGQRQIRTPRLDRLAREGTRFTQFYAGSPVCAPSRAVLMTGRHTGRARVRGNVSWRPRGDAPLLPRDVTIAEVFQDAGYATGAFGKWALGLEGTTGDPARQGFDAFFGFTDQSQAKQYHHDTYERIVDGQTLRLPADTAAYASDLVLDAALDFVDAHADRPFFLYLPLQLPHADLDAPAGIRATYQDGRGQSLFDEPTTPRYGGYRREPQPYATYAAMVTELDRSLGVLFDRLAALGIEDETLVLFTSDNGPHGEGGLDPLAFDSNGPFRGRKRDLYEGGIRVPLLARMPGRVPAGAVSDHAWAFWDLLPTLAAFASAPLPPGLDLDGLDMSGALTGRSAPPEHDHLYWEFYSKPDAEWRQAVRRGDWKAVRQRPDGQAARTELYDIARDPAETTDVAYNHAGLVAELEALMDAAHTRPSYDDFLVDGVDAPSGAAPR